MEISIDTWWSRLSAAFVQSVTWKLPYTFLAGNLIVQAILHVQTTEIIHGNLHTHAT